jgi:hypothetical protein
MGKTIVVRCTSQHTLLLIYKQYLESYIVSDMPNQNLLTRPSACRPVGVFVSLGWNFLRSGLVSQHRTALQNSFTLGYVARMAQNSAWVICWFPGLLRAYAPWSQLSAHCRCTSMPYEKFPGFLQLEFMLLVTFWE